MRASYTPYHEFPLPAAHPFPASKYPLLHGILLDEGLLRPTDVMSPEPLPWAEAARVHEVDYLERFRTGTLTDDEQRRLGLPWSEVLVRRSLFAAQGTIDACLAALEDGVAANLAGGTHHAFGDHGEGYCAINDVAIAIRRLQALGAIERAIVIDLDVHQGNGTAAIFAGDESVFTLSIHGANNYPKRKETSDVDVELPDGTEDADYLACVGRELPRALERARADVAFYVAGVDPVQGDRLGRLALSREGLHAREALVLESCADAHVPLTAVLGGGYAASPEATADLHAVFHREAARRRTP